MALVNLTQAQAEASPYYWSFTTLSQKGNVVTARRRQRGNLIAFVGPNVAAALGRVNSYETYLSNAGVSASHL